MAKKKPGKKKLDFGPFMDEMYRRMDNGEACLTVTDEAKKLDEWARRATYATPYGEYLKWESIRDRIRRRVGGAQGYSNAREYRMGLLLARLRKAAAENATIAAPDNRIVE